MAWLISNAMMDAYGSLPCLPEQAEGSSGGTSSDGEPSALLKTTHTPQASLRPGKTTGFSCLSRFGTTFEISTGSPGEVALTLFREDFPARTSVQPEKEPESPDQSPDCGAKWQGSFARLHPGLSGWRTRQRSLLGEPIEFSGIWPKWGTMLGGACWALQPSVPHITERDGGYLATPKARDWKGQSQRGIHAPGDALPNTDRGDGKPIGGKLNPAWSEYLMGWPLNWTSTEQVMRGTWDAWLTAFQIASSD